MAFLRLCGGIENCLEYRSGIVHEDAGEHPVAHHHLSADNVLAYIQTCNAQRCIIDQCRVRVDALQQHGPIREELVQPGIVRVLLYRPIVLVPAAAYDPFLVRMCFREGCHAGQQIVGTGATDQIHLLRVQAVTEEVAVAIDEARIDPLPGCIVGLLCVVPVADLLLGPQFDYTPVLDGHRFVHLVVPIERNDVRVVYHQIGIAVVVVAGGQCENEER